MKKTLMIIGLALVAGVGIFTLTDSFANLDPSTKFIDMGCGCEACGANCDCGEGKHCGDSACGCDKHTTTAEASHDCDCTKCGSDCKCDKGEHCGDAKCNCRKTAQDCDSGCAKTENCTSGKCESQTDKGCGCNK